MLTLTCTRTHTHTHTHMYTSEIKQPYARSLRPDSQRNFFWYLILHVSFDIKAFFYLSHQMNCPYYTAYIWRVIVNIHWILQIWEGQLRDVFRMKALMMQHSYLIWQILNIIVNLLLNHSLILLKASNK
jgi:hypothetical protein